MRQGILKDFDWDLLGALLANMDNEKQAKFFKSYVKECKSWGTNYQIELQLAHVNDGLSKEERQILSMLGFDKDESEGKE